MYGYAGRILMVDLSKRKVKSVELSESLIDFFLGGLGGNLKLASDLTERWVHPYSPDAYLVLGVGPLVGTMAPGAVRVSAVCKFPLTETYGFASGGVVFGLMMKAAGYDHVVIKGRSKKPVYLDVFDGGAEILDAGDLWGRDVYDVTEELQGRYGPCGVLTIGRAGEKLVRFSVAIMDSCSSLGRGGMGAVMGSKNLKAVVVRGEGGVEVADEKAFSEKALVTVEEICSNPHYDMWVRFGSMTCWEFRTGLIKAWPCDGWRGLMPGKEAETLFGPKVFVEKVKEKTLSCPSCPVGDRLIAKFTGVEEGEVCMSQFFGPAYAFGARCKVGDGGKIAYCYYLANKYGIDYTTLASTVELVRVLRRKGYVKVEFGDDGFEETVNLIRAVSLRDGLGGILAEGPVRAAAKFGRGLIEEVVNVKGMDPPLDGRFNFGTEAFEVIVNPMGGHYIPGFSPTFMIGASTSKLKKFCDRIGVPKDAIRRIFVPYFNVARMTRYVEDWYALLTSLGVCCRQPITQGYSVFSLAELYASATGIKMPPKKLIKTGERVWNLLKLLNVREGFSRRDDAFPERWLKEPLRGGNITMTLMDYYRSERIGVDDAEKLLDDYYAERGWDPESGVPTESKLVELELASTARRMGVIE
ncbi:MAG: aldehyde ferredoxin oxidoreductase N-terminal domain-containing protein [Candidatus Jordarchaeales archaeon]